MGTRRGRAASMDTRRGEARLAPCLVCHLPGVWVHGLGGSHILPLSFPPYTEMIIPHLSFLFLFYFELEEVCVWKSLRVSEKHVV